jgi:D-alanine--poly(phosphoribitol) ligase subunit 1
MKSANQVNLLLEKVLKIPAEKIFCKTWNLKSNNFDIKFYKDLHQDLGRLNHFIEPTSSVLINADHGYCSSLYILAAWLQNGYFIPTNKETPYLKLKSLILKTNPQYILLEDLTEDWIKLLTEINFSGKILCYNTPNSSPEIEISCLNKLSLAVQEISAKERSLLSTSYIISTSGTTGEPKLIKITDTQLATYIENIVNRIPISMNGLIQTFPITFDPSIGDLIWIIEKQSFLVPLNTKNSRFLKEILNQSEEDLWWSSTPSFAKWCLNFTKDLTTNKISNTFFLGEKLEQHFCLNWKSFFNTSKIFNLYGPTEATISISYHQFNETKDITSIIPIGKIHDSNIFHIDPLTNELYLSGPQVIPTYLNPNDNKTYFKTIENTKWYCTGDSCLIKNDELIITGRIDDQIKIHGQRFEPAGMEFYLLNQSFEVLIIPIYSKKSALEIEYLVATTLNKKAQLADIISCLKDHFSHIFLPKKLIYFDNYPITENHKIDRKKIIEKINSETL